jgi:hypothetical protein
MLVVLDVGRPVELGECGPQSASLPILFRRGRRNGIEPADLDGEVGTEIKQRVDLANG